jgi:hypothetical protein
VCDFESQAQGCGVWVTATLTRPQPSIWSGFLSCIAYRMGKPTRSGAFDQTEATFIDFLFLWPGQFAKNID